MSVSLATAISNVNVSDPIGNATHGLFIDEAASLLSTEITQSHVSRHALLRPSLWQCALRCPLTSVRASASMPGFA
jgi:hypothetical protein